MSTGFMVAKKRGPKPKADPKKVLVTMKVNPDFKDWLVEFARRERFTPSQLIEFGLVCIAKDRKFKEPPQR